MARTCQADDALEKQFEALLKQQAGPEVGLLVGKPAAGAKALLYGTIKSPCQEGLDPIVVAGGVGPPATGGGGGGKAGKKPGGAARAAAGAASGGAAVTLEVEWITEHARQVARMLPGGLSVLGLYVFCSDSAYAVAAPELCSLLAGLAAFCLPAGGGAAGCGPGDAATAGGDAQHNLLLLHIDSGSRKQALRALPLSPSSAAAAAAPVTASSLRPVELKFAPTLGSLVLLRCWHGVDLTLLVRQEPGAGGGGGGGGSGEGAQLRRQLAELAAAEAERIRCGIFVTSGGAVTAESAPVGEALAASGSGTGSGGPLHVPTFDLTFLAPPRCQDLQPQQQAAAEASSSGQQQQQAGAVVVGQARLSGCLQGLAFVSKREAVGRAVADLKADLLSSLSARLELLVEEAARVSEQQEQVAGGPQGAAPAAAPTHPLLSSPAQLAAWGGGGCDVALPRRVLLPWLGGSLALCDYLLEGEPAEAAAERAQELLALQSGAGARVVEHEGPAAAAAEGPWQPNAVPGHSLPPAGKAPGGASSSSGLLSGLSCGVTMVASVAVAAVASAVGMLSLLGQPAGQPQQ